MGRPVGEALIAVDRTSHIIYANNGASIVFGWEPKELNGLPLEALIPQRHHGAHRDHVRLFVDSNSAGRTIERPGIWARTKQGFNFECTLVIGKVGPADDPVLVTSVRLRGEP